MSLRIARHDVALLPVLMADNALVLSVKTQLPHPCYIACLIPTSSVARTEHVFCLPIATP
jgi:hypothetical protein